jgi:hypothetical protein
VRVLRFLFGNWYARAYLLVVAAVAVLVALVLWIGGENANLGVPDRLVPCAVPPGYLTLSAACACLADC